MSILNLNRGPLMYPDVGTGGTGEGAPAAPMAGNDTAAGPAGAPEPTVAGTPPAAPAAPVAPPAAPAPAAPAADASIHMTSDQLNDRMARERSAYLTRMGVGSEAELTALVTRDKEATEAAEKARREQQTREEQLAEDVTTAKAERDAAIAERDQLSFESHVATICATVGVRNLPYATHMVELAANALPEGEELDVEAYLAERVDPENAEHAQTRAAFGIQAAVGTVAAPVTTTAAANGSEPTPPPAGGGDPVPTDAMAMTSAQWNAHLEAKGMR